MPETGKDGRAVLASLTRRDLLCCFLLVAGATAYMTPTLLTYDRLPSTGVPHYADWVSHLFFHSLLREGLFQWGQVPLWTQYPDGGYPIIGHPEYAFPSPLLAAPVVLGAPFGLKVNWWFVLCLAALGAYGWARGLGVPRDGAFAAAALFAFTGFASSHLASLRYSEMYFLLTPMMAFLLVASERRPLVLLPAALLYATAILEGKLTVPAIGIFLGALTLIRCCPGQHRRSFSRRPLLCLAVFVVLSVSWSAVKILPMGELVAQDPGQAFAYEDVRGYHGDTARMWTGFMVAETNPTDPSTWGAWVMLALACLGLWRWPLPRLPWVLLCAFFFLVPFKEVLGIPLFRVLYHLPYLSAMLEMGRYFSPLPNVLAVLLAGNGVAWLLRQERRWLRVLAGLVALVALSAGVVERSLALADSFCQPHFAKARAASFYAIQPRGVPITEPWPARADFYRNFLCGLGTLDAYMTVKRRIYAAPKYFVDRMNRLHPNPEYRGEAFCLLPDNAVEVRERSPNRVVLGLRLHCPDTVVLNQNACPGWTVGGASMVDYEGLLAARVRDVNQRFLVFEFLPRSFYLGAWISFLALILGIGGLVLWQAFESQGTCPHSPLLEGRIDQGSTIHAGGGVRHV